MSGELLSLLLTPSPILHWLLLTLPLTIALAGALGALEQEAGNRRLALLALTLLIWLFLPLTFDDPMLAQLSGAVSILGWLGLVRLWAGHIWQNRPTPVWPHALVIGQLFAILLACTMALLRALSGASAGAV